ncbi:hypothetical protein BDV39DRAFT_192375 [Aspergillus sergii]|uniref:Zn(2)-C6 fungal-type domain-containing protein n=1 Tax=Aspergillus sergii TaxID=1034303 RepID=A0A5N6X771_9EURO|nr:hypothetical protein BDV39DRAFT_192375 [Aspergillus sergii]
MPKPDSRRTEARKVRKTTPAPYGGACINCARAKCKCLLLATGDRRERCDRLGKECRPSLSVRRSRKGSSSTRIARVESRLDSLLSTMQIPGITIQSSFGQLVHIPSDTSTRLLEQFRNENLNYLPCIHIPPHVTPQEFMQEKPFFWYCLTAVPTPNLIKRESLFTKVHDTIYQKLLEETTPSMDLPLGLMTFISW